MTTELIWFNISAIYSACCAAWAFQSSGTSRLLMVFLAVHGGLWAIFRAIGYHAQQHRLESERQ